MPAAESSPAPAAESSPTPAAQSPLAPAAQSPAPAEGPDLDYRFTLAGERTFLAWIRTALGLLAGGVAVHELVQPFGHHDIRSVLAISCIVLSAVIALGAFGRWRLVGAAMREGRPLPNTVMVPILAIGIAVIAMLAGIGLLLS
ncbi:YidH family protein [Nocardia aobensis]|uniref:YidH family protein n=1 Tax=Nocardia aobensis TaxID=257277 RepID=A0ABW6P0C8_9NOCA